MMKMKMDPKKKKQYVLIAAAVLALIAIVVAVGVTLDARNENAGGELIPEATHYIAIDVQDYGTITAELYGNIAPVTVENFVKLINDKFYDGLTFHRIISGFMIQGGCPRGDGYGGSGTNIKGEFAQNGVNNPLKHTRGVLSMARGAQPNTASSQFFIMHQDAPHLDGGYAGFGKVLSGLEVVDAICQNTPVADSNGSVLSENQPVITSIRLIDKP